MTSVHYVNILHHLHVIYIYTFYITSFAYSTLHYLHTIVYILHLYIYKCATLMYFLSSFLADANFPLANFKL